MVIHGIEYSPPFYTLYWYDTLDVSCRQPILYPGTNSRERWEANSPLPQTPPDLRTLHSKAIANQPQVNFYLQALAFRQNTLPGVLIGRKRND